MPRAMRLSLLAGGSFPLIHVTICSLPKKEPYSYILPYNWSLFFLLLMTMSAFPLLKAPNLYYSAQQLDQIRCLRPSGGNSFIPKATQLSSVCNEFHKSPTIEFSELSGSSSKKLQIKSKSVGRNNNKFYFVYLPTQYTHNILPSCKMDCYIQICICLLILF